MFSTSSIDSGRGASSTNSASGAYLSMDGAAKSSTGFGGYAVDNKSSCHYQNLHQGINHPTQRSNVSGSSQMGSTESVWEQAAPKDDPFRDRSNTM